MAGKQYFLTLIGILLTACGGSPLIDNLRVRDLTYDVPTNIHVSGSPFAILDRRWFKEKKDEELRISGEAGIWFYIPDEWNGSCHVEVESSEGTGLSFVWMNSSIEGTDGVVDVPMTRPGLMRLSIQSPSEIPVASVSIRMDGIDLVYRSPVDLKDREGIFAMEEFFTTGTFPLKRDHVPAVLVEGSRALTIALPQPIDASSLTSRLLKLRGNPVSGSLILRGTGGTERKISIQLSETGNLRDLEAEFKDPFPVTEITLSLDQKPGDAAMWLSPCLTFQKRQPVPNILLITLDTTRADALGAYGRNPSVTPNLDDLASTSHVFLTARAPSPWTLPSHASLFTGLLPSRHGAGVHIPYLSPRHATLAETFSRLGYCTAGFSGGELTKGRLGLARGFSFYRDPWHFERRADDLTDDVIDYLDSNRGYPFFLFLNYFDPHAPYNAPGSAKDRLSIQDLIRNRTSDDPLWQLAQGYPETWDRWMEGAYLDREGHGELIESLYLAEVYFMDQAFGRLIGYLKSNGLYDSTLIIAVGDHGEFLGEHGLLTHTTRLYEPVLRIPMIFHLPGQSQGERSDRSVALQDIYPTLLTLSGEPVSENLDGRDLLNLSPSAGYFLGEEHECLPLHPLISWMKTSNHLYAFIQRDVKVILNMDALPEVYDLATDPGETHNLCSERREWVDRVTSMVQAYRDSISSPGADMAYPLSQDETKALKSLGYLQ